MDMFNWETLLTLHVLLFDFGGTDKHLSLHYNVLFWNLYTVTIISSANYMTSKVWHEISSPFIKFKGATVEV